MHFKLSELFSLSSLEVNRISTPKSDLKNIAAFSELEKIIETSLSSQEKIQTAQTANRTLGNPVPLRATPSFAQKPFQDDALMKKLLKYRDQIPVSARIIRATDS